MQGRLGAWATCESPFTTPELAEYGHRLDVIATDHAGNQAAAQKDFIVDLHTVGTTLTAGPTGTISDRAPTFEFEATQVHDEPDPTFECQVDGGGFEDCTSPHQVDPLADGDHTFEVRAVDAAGNIDPTPATRAFTVDTPDTRPDPEPPSNEFELSKPKRDKKRGTATVTAVVPGPGSSR